MSAALAATAIQTNCPDPHQDRPAPSADSPTSTGRLLRVVRALIDYGRQLAATLQQRTPATDLTDITRNYGSISVAQILACITRGLLRAAALETRLSSRPASQPAAPVTLTTPTRRQPRAARPKDPIASAADPRLARLPTPADIAAQVRRRPIGAVLADICRDLGIMPSNPLWRELSLAVIANGGNLATLYKDITRRAFTWLTNLAATVSPPRPLPHLPATLAPGTGPS